MTEAESSRLKALRDLAYAEQTAATIKVEQLDKAIEAALLRENPTRRRETALSLAEGGTPYWLDYPIVEEALAAGEVTPEEMVAPLLAWCREKAGAK